MQASAVAAIGTDRAEIPAGPTRQYGMPFMGYDIRFHVADQALFIDGWKKS